jgi:hypothetical protein
VLNTTNPTHPKKIGALFLAHLARQGEFLPSLGVRRLSSVNFHILIFSSETALQNEPKIFTKNHDEYNLRLS